MSGSFSISWPEREGPELRNRTRDGCDVDTMLRILEAFPWEDEVAWFEKTGEGGSIHILEGDMAGAHRLMHIIPVEPDQATVFVEIQLRRGRFLGLIGREAVERDLSVPRAELPTLVRAFATVSIEALYERYSAIPAGS
jgi:hypothetical protein